MGLKASFKITGDKELIQKLYKAEEATLEVISVWLNKWALEIEKKTLENLQDEIYDQPIRWHYIRTGFLRSGVTHVLEDLGTWQQSATIGVGGQVMYAKYVENLRPYLRPAFEEVAPKAMDDLLRILDYISTKIGGN